MVKMQVNVGVEDCQCTVKVKGSLTKVLREITIGVLAVLHRMSDGDQRVKEVLIDAIADGLRENKDLKFTTRRENNERTK